MYPDGKIPKILKCFGIWSWCGAPWVAVSGASGAPVPRGPLAGPSGLGALIWGGCSPQRFSTAWNFTLDIGEVRVSVSHPTEQEHLCGPGARDTEYREDPQSHSYPECILPGKWLCSARAGSCQVAMVPRPGLGLWEWQGDAHRSPLDGPSAEANGWSVCSVEMITRVLYAFQNFHSGLPELGTEATSICL